MLEHLEVVDYGDALITEDVKESTANVIRKVEKVGKLGPGRLRSAASRPAHPMQLPAASPARHAASSAP